MMSVMKQLAGISIADPVVAPTRLEPRVEEIRLPNRDDAGKLAFVVSRGSMVGWREST
jgi:hypothetical protein